VLGHGKLAGAHLGHQRLPGFQLVDGGALRAGTGALGIPACLRPFGSANGSLCLLLCPHDLGRQRFHPLVQPVRPLPFLRQRPLFATTNAAFSSSICARSQAVDEMCCMMKWAVDDRHTPASRARGTLALGMDPSPPGYVRVHLICRACGEAETPAGERLPKAIPP
jgi:hypothetical protein